MILVTGGAGFIGSNLVAAANKAGITDIAIGDFVIERDRNKTKNIADLIFQELISPHEMLKWLQRRKVEAVIHLGAITDTTRTDGEVFAVNFALSIELFDICTEARIPFIYASSAATYGDGSHGFSDAGAVDWLCPKNVYGWSKQCFDQWVLRRGVRRRDHPPTCVGLKFFNVYGPREAHKGKMASIVSQKWRNVQCGDPIVLFQNNERQIKRDFVHVDDVCAVILWFFDAKNEFGIFNVGTGVAHSFEDVVTQMAACFDQLPVIRHTPVPESMREMYQYFTQADLTKLRRVGYDRDFLSLRDGVRQTIRAYGGATEVAA